MPMLVLVVAVDLDELLENRSATACAANRKPCGVVEVTEDAV